MNACNASKLRRGKQLTRLRLVSPLCVLAWLAIALAGQNSGGSALDRSQILADVPRVPADGFTTVEVFIQTQGPFLFEIDTASANSVIDPELAAKLRLKRIGTVKVDDSSGKNKTKSDKYLIPSLTLGGLELNNITATTANLQGFSKRVYGILGFSAFREYQLVLDFPAGRIQLLRPGTLALDDKEAGSEVFHYETRYGLAAIPITLGDTKMLALIDTGNTGEFIVPDKVMKRLHFMYEPLAIGTFQTLTNSREVKYVHTRDTLTIGGYTCRNAGVVVGTGLKDANLGWFVLRQFRITFDQQRQLVEFARAASEFTLGNQVLADAPGDLSAYVGTYGPRVITLQEGQLLSKNADDPVIRLLPLGNDAFDPRSNPRGIFQFVRDAQGRVISLRMSHEEDDNGGRSDWESFDRAEVPTGASGSISPPRKNPRY
jgi:hypothetical protein